MYAKLTQNATVTYFSSTFLTLKTPSGQRQLSWGKTAWEVPHHQRTGKACGSRFMRWVRERDENRGNLNSWSVLDGESPFRVVGYWYRFFVLIGSCMGEDWGNIAFPQEAGSHNKGPWEAVVSYSSKSFNALSSLWEWKAVDSSAQITLPFRGKCCFFP